MKPIYLCRIIILILLLCMAIGNQAQITVTNPSFEDQPADATTPQGWHPCDDLTTPDIFPGFWGVYNEPSDGNTYVGIITRENSTYETFGQRLSSTVTKERCYRTAIDLAHSKVYAGYNRPIQMRIYIGDTKCSRDQLIFQSPTISSMEWKTFQIEFKPEKDYDFIIIEAYFSDEPFSHKGNILIDNLRPITSCGNA